MSLSGSFQRAGLFESQGISPLRTCRFFVAGPPLNSHYWDLPLRQDMTFDDLVIETSQPQRLLKRWYLPSFRPSEKHKNKEAHIKMREGPHSEEGTKCSKLYPACRPGFTLKEGTLASEHLLLPFWHSEQTTKKPHQYWCVYVYEGKLNQFDKAFRTRARNSSTR